MKKRLLIIGIVLCSIPTVKAQVSFNPGFRGGMNFAKLTQLDADFKTGFYASFIGELKLGKFYSLQPEIGYSEQGAKGIKISEYDYQTESTSTYEIDTRISYVSVGITNKLRFTDRFNFHLGPIIDVATGPNRYTNIDLDLSFTAGIGITLVDNLQLEARLKKGIIDVFESDYYESNGYYDDIGDNNTNFLFQVGLSYTFNLKG